MIPPVIGSHVISEGEHDLFHAFKNDPTTSDWVVMHSLDIAKHETQVSGEIDFVIIVPRLGIVCLEVKACHSFKFREGYWQYGNSDHRDYRGPFKQAARAMHSLRDQVAKANPRLKSIVFCSAVAFTHAKFNFSSPEWHSWQVFDCEDLDSHSLAELIFRILHNMRQHLAITPSVGWFHSDELRPDSEDVERLIKVLRPNFESYESPRIRSKKAKAEVKRYTEEQYRALDFAEGNERLVFEGPAGTGKTLLAIESARRAARLGLRTLFLCYNELLGEWLEGELEPLGSLIEFDRIARRMLQVSSLKPQQESHFWSITLPRTAVTALKEGSKKQFLDYDQLIVDEAQDFLRNGYVDFLNCSVRGGLKGGRVMLFGDFERQSVYHAADLTLAELKKSWMHDLASFRLRDNCRNTPRVAALASILGGLNPDYHSILRKDDLIDPSIIEYGDDVEQAGKLADVLIDLLNEGYETSDIVVLSMRPLNMCVSKIMRQDAKSRLSGGEQPGKQGVLNTTIRRYKGLEAPVIIITDIDEIVSDEAQKLLYVAVTRAINKLFLFLRSGARQEYVKVAEKILK